MAWRINKKIEKKKGILIQGLPGIGNVGRIVVEYMIEELKAKRIGSYIEKEKPAVLFINEEGIEEPIIEIYHAKKKNLYLIKGNYQPINEKNMWRYASETITLAKKMGINKVITIGGVASDRDTNNPNVYITGTSKELIEELVKNGANKKIYGVIGSIMGAAGILLVEAKKKGIKAATLLGETTQDLLPGLRVTKKILKILSKTYNIDINTRDIEKEIRKGKAIMRRLVDSEKEKKEVETSYIG